MQCWWIQDWTHELGKYELFLPMLVGNPILQQTNKRKWTFYNIFRVSGVAEENLERPINLLVWVDDVKEWKTDYKKEIKIQDIRNNENRILTFSNGNAQGKFDV